MAEDIEKIIGDEEPTSPQPSPEEQKAKDEELEKKNQQLANVQKAIDQANAELRSIREAKRTAQTKPKEEDEVTIDFTDPSSKAWDKHIQEHVAPVSKELEREKEEIRTFALQEFLQDKPALAASPEKVKELIVEFEALSNGRISGKTKEGVMIYLKKAYASVFHEQLLEEASSERVEKAKLDSAFSDIAISKGATSYGAQKEHSPSLSEDDRAILAKWGMTPSEWTDTYKKHGKE